MLNTFSFVAAMAVASSSLVVAQTFTSCDPIKKANCPSDPAIGGTFTTDFTKGADEKVFSTLAGTDLTYDGNTGALFSIKAPNDAPTVQSNAYLFFGRLDVVMQAAPGAGVVTSIVMQSDDLDEIDYELIGSDQGHVQTNYFHQGNTTTYDRGATFAVASPMTGFHTYSIIWTAASIQWLYDGAVLRTVTFDDAYGGLTYPQTPMRIKCGTWVAGKAGNAPGTINWAGGLTDFSKQPFNAYYKSITVHDYSNGVAGAKEYRYGDLSGTYPSIVVSTTGTQDEVNNSVTLAPATMLTSVPISSVSTASSQTIPALSSTSASLTTTHTAQSSSSCTSSHPVSSTVTTSATADVGTDTTATNTAANTATGTFVTSPATTATRSSTPPSVPQSGAVGSFSGLPMVQVAIAGAAWVMAQLLL